MAADARLRAFWALPLQDAARAVAVEVQGTLRHALGDDDWRWSAAEGFHVTLCFLGEIPEAAVAGLVRSARTALEGSPSFAMSLGAPGGFPNTRRPRVIALPVRPEAPVAALAARIEGSVARVLSWETEGRRFRPHLTLARLRRGRRAPLHDVTASVTPPTDAGLVTECVLFRSQLSRDGARYTPLARLPLAPEAAEGDANGPLHP